MMNKLSIRLSLAFVLVTWLVIAAIALLIQQSVGTNFRYYVQQRALEGMGTNLILSLEDYYAQNGSWGGAEEMITTRRSDEGSSQGRGRQGQSLTLLDTDLQVIATTDTSEENTPLDPALLEQATPLQWEGQTVGWLLIATPGMRALGDTETRFLDDMTSTLLATALIAGVLAVIVGGLLSWHLGQPIRQLTSAVREMSSGVRGQQVAIQGADEITELAHAFNQFSKNLAEGEALRERMAANVAHELRTPVTVLRGHLEAMLDDVLPLDKAQITIAHDQTLHLARLVADLRLLTLAEARQIPLERQTIAPEQITSRIVESFQLLAQDANITLQADIAQHLPAIHVDVDRIRQVLANLLTNALRHTPTEGRIDVRVTQQEQRIRFAVSNTGHSLSPDEIDHLFEPFWRADESRHRDSGGSGLGLAISRQLVQLHGGDMWAEQHPQQLTFAFDLPIAPSA